MKGYQSDRVVQTFDAVGSRRDLLRAVAIGLPALVLASAGASAMQDGRAKESAKSSARIREAGPLPAVPMVVVVRGQTDIPPLEPNAQTEELWQELAKDMASRVPDAKIVVADQSGHAVKRYRPEVVAEATEQVVDAARDPGSWKGDA